MPTEAQKKANKRYRELHPDKVRQLTNEYVKKYYNKNKADNNERYIELLAYARDKNTWKYFINNNSFKKEQKLFLNILL